MKHQVIFIHGGTSFSEYSAFLKHLQTTELRYVLEDKPRRWKQSLREELGSGFEVYLPSMPNSDNAKYEEWKIWFERYLEFVDEEVILIGHSQGGYFLAKYLTENTLQQKIKALFFVAAAMKPDDFGGEDGGDFAFDLSKLPSIQEQVEQIYILHSTDDPVVPYDHALAYKTALPEANFIQFEDRGHFLGEEFPELIDLIKKAAQ